MKTCSLSFIYTHKCKHGDLKEIETGKITQVCNLPDNEKCSNFKYGGKPYELHLSL